MTKIFQHLPDPQAWIGQSVSILIDRPLGSRHPTHGFLYPLNYGYVPGQLSADGEDLDAYVLGIRAPLQAFTGTCIAVIHRRDDDDDKLVLAPPGMVFSDEQIRELTWFQEQYFDSVLLR